LSTNGSGNGRFIPSSSRPGEQRKGSGLIALIGDMNRARSWLKENKIFFETITASLLSAMALTVAIAQWIVSSKQTSLMSLQTRIAEVQALPRFELAIHQKLNEATHTFDDNELIISNHGGAVRNFRAEVAYFLEITSGRWNPPNGIHHTELPISGYFTASFISTAGTEQLVKMVGDHNNARFANLTREMETKLDNKGLGFANPTEDFLVRLIYRDLLDRLHEDYYQVGFIGGGIRIDE
jgi:hypothetical protein